MNQWIFCAGQNKELSRGILLEDFTRNCQELLDTGQLFHGHKKFHHVYNTRNQIQLEESVLRHVSAHGLKSLVAPSFLQAHLKMSDSNKLIWDEALNEEFDGLSSLPTWEVLTETQFKSLGPDAKALPSMAIATIK